MDTKNGTVVDILGGELYITLKDGQHLVVPAGEVDDLIELLGDYKGGAFEFQVGDKVLPVAQTTREPNILTILNRFRVGWVPLYTVEDSRGWRFSMYEHDLRKAP